MFKSSLVVSALALAAPGWQQERWRPVLTLKEEALTLRYTANANEGVILVEAESETELDSEMGSLSENHPEGAYAIGRTLDGTTR